MLTCSQTLRWKYYLTLTLIQIKFWLNLSYKYLKLQIQPKVNYNRMETNNLYNAVKRKLAKMSWCRGGVDILTHYVLLQNSSIATPICTNIYYEIVPYHLLYTVGFLLRPRDSSNKTLLHFYKSFIVGTYIQLFILVGLFKFLFDFKWSMPCIIFMCWCSLLTMFF